MDSGHLNALSFIDYHLILFCLFSCEKKNPILEIAPPSWLALEPGVQVYSGHCVKVPGEDSACPQVDVLALLDANVEPTDFLCKFW